MVEKKVVANQALSPELISLVHHIELNQLGWWDKALQQFIIAAAWINGKPFSIEENCRDMKNNFCIDIDSNKVLDQIKILLEINSLILINQDQYKISEEKLHTIESDIRNGEEADKELKEKFLTVLLKYKCKVDPEAIWLNLNKYLLYPLIRKMGAKIYEIISGNTLNLEERLDFVEFLKGYPEDERNNIKNTIIDFFNPQEFGVRKFILRQLNAYFFIEAANLKRETIKTLMKVLSSKPNFYIFVDTNFLFSLLGFHDNPSNEIAVSLSKLVEKIKNEVSIKLYILPITLEEARHKISSWCYSLKNIVPHSNLVKAALQQGGLGAVAQKFLYDSGQSEKLINAEDYFKPYLTDLISIIKQKGIELYNENLNGYSTRQDVVDDIIVTQEHRKNNFPEKANRYEAIAHDMILWHWVKDKRGLIIESPLDAKYWIITIDFLFIGFDTWKNKKSMDNLSICLHPANFFQMLQFWIPRTDEFEEAILGAFRLPFIFQEFDANSEKATIRIVESLSRFQDIKDLSVKTISNILTNQALRQKMLVKKTIEERVSLVKDEIIVQNKKIHAELMANQEKIKDLNSKVSTLEIGMVQKSSNDNNLILEIKNLEQKIKEKDLTYKNLLERIKFVAKNVVGLGILLFVMGVGLVSIFTRFIFKNQVCSIGIVSAVLIIAYLLLVSRAGKKKENIYNCIIFLKFEQFKGWLLAIPGIVIIALLVEYVKKKLWP